uniref:ELKS/Rab6-interacting/CAST family member 1-like n=1 Tax=Phallusia mammillata TaxID=59560 RepID=A0A6F9DCX5_9ASCI|nr:ELKS/Rab6-interacting/CAST family member 1-like [Phallusia mammillata]
MAENDNEECSVAGHCRPRPSSNGKTLSMENIQSLNAAYTTRPSYANQFEGKGRSKTLGRLNSLSAYRNSNPGRHRARPSIMASTPNLSSATTNHNTTSSNGPTSDSPSVNRRSGGQTAGSSTLQVNGPGTDERKRYSGSDYILQLQQENEALRREIDLKESKLQSNMNSIKTFWSPELKKERSLRKEESIRILALREQFKVAQDENQHSQLTMQALQDELRAQRDLNQLLQDDYASGQRSDPSLFSGISGDSRVLQEDNERLARENELLQRTMEEMETRIEAQRQTLDTRDESVRKLLEMLQCKGLSKSDDSSVVASVEMDALRVQVADYESSLAHTDMLLSEKTRELQKMKMEADVYDDSASKTKAMQSILDIKDTKIASLERIIHELEDELNLVRSDGAMNSAERQEEIKQLEVYKSHSNFMKTKIEQLKSDLQKKETEMVSLQTRLDTLNNQQSDSRQHIDVLKESLTAKEQRAAILQSEVDSLRTRLDEKQQVIDQKQEHLARLQEERSSNGSELSHLRDTLDVKDRKIAVLHKKIESLAEVVREKDRQITANSERMSALQQDSSTSDSALSTMEEALTEKDKVIERLRSSQESAEDKFREEVDDLKKAKRALEKRLEGLQKNLAEKETSLSEVQEHASSLASSSLKKDSKMKQIEISLQQKNEEVGRLTSQLKKASEEHEENQTQQSVALAKTKEESKEKIEGLEKALKEKSEEVTRGQGELDRLLEILKETENEKHNKDKKIMTLEKQTRDLNGQIKTLNAQMIEEMKKKGAAQDKDLAKLLRQMKTRDERIDELEEALRESVSITAEREIVLSKEEDARHKVEKQLEELVREFEQTKAILAQTGGKLTASEASLHEKERLIQQMRIERRKHLEEAFDVKQQALLAAISEKDANIALLELSQSRKRTNAEEVCLLRREKDKLVQQLKQQTQNRLNLMQDTADTPSPHPPQSSKSQQGNGKTRYRPNSAEDDGEGIWA